MLSLSRDRDLSSKPYQAVAAALCISGTNELSRFFPEAGDSSALAAGFRRGPLSAINAAASNFFFARDLSRRNWVSVRSISLRIWRAGCLSR
jgi:hypothetical protein